MLIKLNEDTIGKLATQFDTLPDLLRGATDDHVATDESPDFYKGYITAVMMIASLLNEQKVPINYDVLAALAGKAAQLCQALLIDEKDTSWIDHINTWLEASYRSEMASANRH